MTLQSNRVDLSQILEIVKSTGFLSIEQNYLEENMSRYAECEVSHTIVYYVESCLSTMYVQGFLRGVNHNSCAAAPLRSTFPSLIARCAPVHHHLYQPQSL